MNKGRNLLDNSELIKTHPEFDHLFNSASAVYGDVIFSERMRLGYTQSELANKANVSIKTIARVEGGSMNITLKSFEKVFKALN